MITKNPNSKYPIPPGQIISPTTIRDAITVIATESCVLGDLQNSLIFFRRESFGALFLVSPIGLALSFCVEPGILGLL